MDEIYFINCLAYFTFAVIAIFCYIRYVYTFFSTTKIPNGPTPTFPFGNIMEMVFQNTTFHEEIQKVYKRCKRKVYKLCGMYLFLKPCVLVFDPNLIIKSRSLDVFETSTIYCNNKDNVFKDFTIETLGYEVARKYKNKLKDIVQNGVVIKWNINKLVHICRKTIEEDLLKYSRTSKSINIKDVLSKLTINISAICNLGVDYKTIKDFDSNLIDNIQCLYSTSSWDNIKQLFVYIYPGLSKYLRMEDNQKKKFHRFETIVKHILDNKSNETQMSKCHVLQLIADIENDNEGVVNYNEIAHFCLNTWLENLETLYTTLVYCLYELSSNEFVQDKLVEEINCSKTELTLENIDKFNYLDLVVNEVFRKYPLIYTETRLCKKSFEINDLAISKGTYVVFPLNEICRDAQYYPMPQIFNPNRIFEYVKNERLLPEDDTYFSCNNENFIGLPLIKQQMKIILVQLLESFKFYIDEKSYDLLQFDGAGFLIYSNKPLWVKVRQI